MRIQDVSDRVYQGQVYALLDQARSSIVISMYLIRPGEDLKHPVNRLLEDLIEARGRGVEVSIYLNTKFKGQDPQKLVEGPWFDRLRQAGVVLKLVSPVRRLHDKLVIVDRKFVVEGSMNWSVSAIAENLESATLIESPELAEAKLRRIQFFPIWGKEEERVPRKKRIPETPDLFPAGAPASIEVPVLLLEGRLYLPRMISDQSERAFKLMLLLLYFSHAKGAQHFVLSLEAAALFLGILRGEDRTGVRRQMVRTLRELQTGPKLLETEFRHGQDARIKLHLPPQPTFAVGSEDLEAGELAVLSDNEIFLRLVRARLRGEGKRLEELTQREIERRFFIDVKTLRRTLRESRKAAPAPL